jgi:hypothetical protein
MINLDNKGVKIMNQAKRFIGILSLAGLVLLTAFAFGNANTSVSITSDDVDCEASGSFNLVGTVTAADEDSLTLAVTGGTSAKAGLASDDENSTVEISTSSDTEVMAGNEDASVDEGDHVLVKGEASGDAGCEGLEATSVRILGSANASGSVNVGDGDDNEADEQDSSAHVNSNAEANANANASFSASVSDDDEESGGNGADVDASAEVDAGANADVGGQGIGADVKAFVHGMLDKD